MRRRAFTLPELLVVLAIIALIAGVLFPVFARAREAARKAACISNFKQAYAATSLYLTDYDDLYMPSNYLPGTENSSSNDRTWVQLVMPYVNTYGIFRCPSDNTDRPRREALFDQDLIPGDTYSQYYTASLRTNIGYNYIYFAPVYRMNNAWIPVPRTSTDISSREQTVLFIDSVWTKPGGAEFPSGGGSYVVVPPCRYESVQGQIRDTFQVGGRPGLPVFTSGVQGWEVGEQQDPLQFGGAWPWHNGRITALHADGSARTYSPNQLVTGCEPKPQWEGLIYDVIEYLWDLR